MPNPGLAFLFTVFGSLDAQGTNMSRLAKGILLPKVSKTSPRASEMSKHNWKCGEIFIRRRVNECFIQKVTGSLEFLIKSWGAIRSRLSSAFSGCALRKSTTNFVFEWVLSVSLPSTRRLSPVLKPISLAFWLQKSISLQKVLGNRKLLPFSSPATMESQFLPSFLLMFRLSLKGSRGGKSIIYLLFKLILSPKNFARLKLKALARR